MIPGPLPASVDIVVADRIYIKKEDLPQPLPNRVIRLAAFSNPEFYKAQVLRCRYGINPRVIVARKISHGISPCPEVAVMPSGPSCCQSDRAEYQDERIDGQPINAAFVGTFASRTKMLQLKLF